MLLFEARIPEFIRSSPYLQSLLSNGPFPDTGLEIPDGSGKQDLTVRSKADLIELLHTIRFWLVPEVAEMSSDLLRFAFMSEADFIEVASEFRNDISFIDVLLQIVTSEDCEKLEIAAKFNYLPLLRFLCEKVGLQSNSQAACVAAGEGHLDCLMYLHSRGAEFSNFTIEASARGGHFECTKYIVDNRSSRNKQPHIAFACMSATQGGQLKCVQLMLSTWGDRYNKIVLREAATKGYLEILQYITTLPHDESEIIGAMTVCVLQGHLQCLKHLHSLGYEKGSRLMIYAATEGHLSCLQFLHEHNYLDGEYMNVCYVSAERGHLKCMKCAHELGMVWNERTCTIAARVRA